MCIRDSTYRLPPQSRWVWVEGSYAYLSTIPYLREEAHVQNATVDCDSSWFDWGGWSPSGGDGGPAEFALTDLSQAEYDEVARILDATVGVKTGLNLASFEGQNAAFC